MTGSVAWRRRIRAGLLVVALAVLLSGCGAQGPASAIQVEMKDFSYAPETIEVAKGSRVTLRLRNSGSLPHDLTIDELGVRSRVISSKQGTEVTFVAKRRGSFPFYCLEPGHRDSGMHGLLVVTD